MYKTLVVMLAVATMAYAQEIINVINFSDDYCLCPNAQHLAQTGTCVPVLGGYNVYRLNEGTPETVVLQHCSDAECTDCTNTTTYDTHPPCQPESDGLSWYSVLPENDVTTYYNAPSVMTIRYPYKNCSGDAYHVDIFYGLSCFPTATGSYYYDCSASAEENTYYVYNCTDSACLEGCEGTVVSTEQCADDEGVYYSVACTASSTNTATSQTSNQNTVSTGQTATSQTATSQTATGQTAANTIGSATVSTTTSASSHNVSSSASAAAGTAGSSSIGGSTVAQNLFSDVRGGNMLRKAPRANPPFCNGGIPVSSSSNDATSTGGTSAAAATSASGGSSGGSSSGGRGNKIFVH